MDGILKEGTQKRARLGGSDDSFGSILPTGLACNYRDEIFIGDWMPELCRFL